MPNHVENIIQLRGDQKRIREMLEQIKDDDFGIGTIDFQKVIPMPASLDIISGSKTHTGFSEYQRFIEVYTFGVERTQEELLNIPKDREQLYREKFCPEMDDETWDLGRQAFQNKLLYGHTDWYQWRIDNWGTKWNAYGYEEGVDYSESEGIYCQTAWSAPHPVMEKLAQMFPDVEMSHAWADEDLGSNCGRVLYIGGECVEEYIPETNIEAMEFACSVWEYDTAELGYMKNAAGTDYINTQWESYDVVEFQGQKMLYSKEQITSEGIPEGTYCYDIGETPRGDSVFPSGKARHHVGTLICKNPLDLGEVQELPVPATAPVVKTSATATFEKFMDEDFDETIDDGMKGMTM